MVNLPASFSVCLPYITKHTFCDNTVIYTVSGQGVSGLANELSLTPRLAMIQLLHHDIWPLRFFRNSGFFCAEEQAHLLASRAAIVGCGGLGGMLALLAARIGFGALTLCDGDTFEESNLNRQVFCTERVLGQNKAQITAEKIMDIASHIDIKTLPVFAQNNVWDELVAEATVLFDGLDNFQGRIQAEQAAHGVGISFIYGSLAGVEGFAGISRPNVEPAKKIAFLLSAAVTEKTGAEHLSGVPAITPALIASVQMYLGVTQMLGKNNAPATLWHMDFSSPAWSVFSL